MVSLALASPVLANASTLFWVPSRILVRNLPQNGYCDLPLEVDALNSQVDAQAWPHIDTMLSLLYGYHMIQERHNQPTQTHAQKHLTLVNDATRTAKA